MISSRLFRSRWSALFWASGILWTAHDIAEAQPDAKPTTGNGAAANATPVATDALGDAVDAKDLAILANMASQ